MVALKWNLLISSRGLFIEELGVLLGKNLLYSFRIENTKRVNKNRTSMAEKRILWGHGDRKMNPSHWIAAETLSED